MAGDRGHRAGSGPRGAESAVPCFRHHQGGGGLGPWPGGEPPARSGNGRRSYAGTGGAGNPLAVEPACGPARDGVSAMDGGNTTARLLLVDDDEAACTLLAEVLERERYHVSRALSVAAG